MGIETELKFALPPRQVPQLAAHPLLAAHRPTCHRLISTYFDTLDQTLYRLGVAVRLRRQGERHLLAVKTTEAGSGGLARRREWECEVESSSPKAFDFGMVDEPLRGQLVRLLPSLRPVFKTVFERSAWRLARGASQIEVALDRGHITTGKRRAAICEVELELLAGNLNDLFCLGRELQQATSLRPTIASKAERGYDLFNGSTRRPFRAGNPKVCADMTAVEALRAIALHCLEHLQRNEIVDARQADPEFVHQARVALRRLRCALAIVAPDLPDGFARSYGRVWKVLAAALGEARNCDVLFAETLAPLSRLFPTNEDVTAAAKTCRDKCETARGELIELFKDESYARAVLVFTGALFALPDGDVPVETRAAQSLQRWSKRIEHRMPPENTEDLHRLRIRVKQLRYALEFFAPLWPSKRLKHYLGALGRLQDILGMINDLISARSILAMEGLDAPLIETWISGREELLRNEIQPALAALRGVRPPWKRR